MSYLLKVSELFPCSSKDFLKFSLSSTRLLIKWFRIKKCESYVHHENKTLQDSIVVLQ